MTRGVVRLWTGLVLFAFVFCHLINHSFGIVSVSAQNAAEKVLMAPWVSEPGVVLLTASVLLHIGVNLYTLWQRRTLRLQPWELVQYATGLLVPILMIDHVIANRVLIEFFQCIGQELENLSIRLTRLNP